MLQHFRITDAPAPDLSRWDQIAQTVHNPDGNVCIGLVGKYTDVPDAYKSVMEALQHGGLANNVGVEIKLINSEEFDDDTAPIDILEGVHGIILPGGFGERGARGKMRAARFARERQVPCFGICYGMQLSVVEAARNLVGITGASTTEFGPTDQPIVGLMSEWTKGNELVTRDENTLIWAAQCGSAPIQRILKRRLSKSQRSTARWKSRSATAIAMKSTMPMCLTSKSMAWSSRACHRTASCQRLSSWKSIPGSSRCNIIRS